MGKKMRFIVMALLLVVFCASGSVLFFTHRRYEEEDDVYEQAAEEFTYRPESAEGKNPAPKGDDAAEKTQAGPPLEVDFDQLREVNDEVVGWIYCEDTRIDYPLLRGEDNDYYLSHNYKREYQMAGSIFVEVLNRPDFVDSNTIIYGHHMNNGSMFASLSNWAEQEFYEAHPEMWLLTPEGDYKIILFSGYTTSALSDTYTIFTGPCGELEEYLRQCVENSDFEADVELEANGKYVTLSTCAYDFENARYVLHGKLVPVEE